MMKRLHIVCLDVPYPPDYGGVFDLFYKIKYLSEQGIGIVLHCFEYGRGRQPELEKYCEKVFYYPRSRGMSLTVPYIVYSRRNLQLLERITVDDCPVLLEGIHCTYYLYEKRLENKKVWVRLHNVEYVYYHNLARAGGKLFKKLYFTVESWLLKKYETELARRADFLCVSESDTRIYKSLGAAKAEYLPLFLAERQVESETGKGTFCLYHGNLSVPENEQAVLFLVRKVFSKLDFKFVVAGKRPSRKIRSACLRQDIELIADPDDEEMNRLLNDAQVHVLPSMNATGVKIKLINALYRGRFVLTNHRAVGGSRLQGLCEIAETADEFRIAVQRLMKNGFTGDEIEKRKIILNDEFNPVKNTEILISRMFS